LSREIKNIKRIAMLAHTYYFTDARVQRLAECLAAAGYETHVVCMWEPARIDGCREPREEVVNGAHIHRVRLVRNRGSMARYFYEYLMMTFLGMWKLLGLHFKYKFNVVHIHNMPDFLVLAGLPLKWTGATLVLDVHDPMTELFQENYHLKKSNLLIKLIKMQEWISYRLVDHLLTVSDPMAENVAKKAGCNESDVAVVKNLPDSRKFPIRKNIKNQWPYHNREIKILYCGTVTEHYNLDMAVKAIAKLSSKIPNINLQILGSGNRLEQLLELSQKLGVADKVEHIKPVNQDRVIEIMDGADMGISTHRAGIFGDLYFSTKILEFMTQGLPVISSRTYTIEQLIPESAIFYFEPGNVDDLIRQISFICNNPEVVVDKIRNSREVVLTYNWGKEHRALLSFYDCL